MVQQFLQVLQIVAPVFLLAFAGYVWGRLKLNFDLEFITRLAVNFSMPCLIFAVLVKVEIEPRAVRDMALAALAAYAGLGLVLWLALRAAGWSVRTYLVPGTFGNTGNIGLPVALFAYGEPGLAFAIVIFAIMAILQFTVGIYIVAGSGSVLQVLRQPLVYASVLGGLFAFEGWEIPAWALNSLDLAGQIAIPAMLLTLGVSIANLSVGEVGRATLLSLLKLAAAAAVAVAVAWAFGLQGAARGSLILQIIMPVAVTSYLLAERYRAGPDRIAGAVVVSTLVAAIAVPVALAILL
ncbi:MAG TPA: AEC family transporter [Thermohalobaculum sp.]|nr:AEC family transporter [Thermohalobaculum sp.]